MRSEVLFIIFGMAAVTYFTRFGALAFFKGTGVPVWFERWVKHVPIGILTALIAPALLAPAGQLDISWHNHYLLAGAAAAVAAYYCRNPIWTLLFGFAAMFSLRWLA